MSQYSRSATPYVIGGLIISVIACLIYLAYLDAEQWERFKKDRNCVKVGEMRGSVGTGITVGPNGNTGVVTTVEADKTGWKCDDGMTYWR